MLNNAEQLLLAWFTYLKANGNEIEKGNMDGDNVLVLIGVQELRSLLT